MIDMLVSTATQRQILDLGDVRSLPAIRRARAHLAIRVAGERIRRTYLDGSLDRPTTRMVERAIHELDQTGTEAGEFAKTHVAARVERLIAATDAGDELLADLETVFGGAMLAALALVTGGRAAEIRRF